MLVTEPLDDPEPDRNWPCEWIRWWYRQPENQEQVAELEREYILAMQKDPKLD